MRRFFFIFAFLLLVLGGCSGVWMNQEYSALTDRTTALSVETATRAKAGTLTPAEMAASLDGQSQVWLQIQAAKNGKTTTTAPAK